MPNPHKRRGTAWERAVCDYLREEMPDPDIRRVAQTGHKDEGDVHAAPFVLECKSVGKIDLAGFMDQAVAEAANAGLPYGVAVVKRRGRGVAEGYAVMRLQEFRDIIRRIRANTAAARE